MTQNPNDNEYPEIKLPHEMTDDELDAHEASMAASAARFWGSVKATAPDDADELDDEPTDENGDLIEHIDGDYRSMDEYMDDERENETDEEE